MFSRYTSTWFLLQVSSEGFVGSRAKTLHALFAHICQDFEARLVEANGEDDHVHLLVEYPPKVTLSKLVNSLKGISRRLRQLHPEIARRYYQGVLVIELPAASWRRTVISHSAVR